MTDKAFDTTEIVTGRSGGETPALLNTEEGEGPRLLRRRGVTATPCRIHSASMGGTRLIFELQNGQPTPIFERDRVLFYACGTCSDENFKALMPDCPERHRPYRYASGDGRKKGCHACRQEAEVPNT